jgi:hypothetical protein
MTDLFRQHWALIDIELMDGMQSPQRPIAGGSAPCGIGRLRHRPAKVYRLPVVRVRPSRRFSEPPQPHPRMP